MQEYSVVKQKADIRRKIIDATIGLMKEHGDISLITMRDIAARAGTGAGLINYHFQTKENLISVCSLEMIGSALAQMQAMSQAMQMTAVERLFQLSKGIAEFMAMNEGIARVSITSDITSPKASDNTAQLAWMLLPLVKEICGPGKSDTELMLMLHAFISAIESAFLRRDVLAKTIGFNFARQEQREKFIRDCIRNAFAQ